MKRTFLLSTAVTVVLALAAGAKAQTITALTSTRTLVTFNAATPGTITSTVPITGVSTTETLQSIDYRPIDGQLVAYGYTGFAGTSTVYAINPTTGVATVLNNSGISGNGRHLIDFNPTANAIRVTIGGVTTGNNGRIPTGGTGVPVIDADLNPANAGIVATAYSRNNAGGGTSGATTLYAIDGPNNSLVSQGSIDFFTGNGTSPNSGTLTALAALTGIAGASVVGFDIFNAPGTAATSPGNAFLATATTLFTLNLGTGAATTVGTIGSGLSIVDIAAVGVPEPGSMALCGMAVAGFVGYIRKRRKA